MPQALLPDINYLIQGLVNQVNIAITLKDRLGSSSALMALNQLLPPEFQLIFNAQGYKKENMERLFVLCNLCDHKTDVTHIQPHHQVSSTTYYDDMLGKSTKCKFIRCEECGSKLLIDQQTDYIVSKANTKEYEGKFAPPEPAVNGLISDSVNETQFWRWVYLVRKLLFTKLRMYRESYRSKDDTSI